ARRRVLRAEVPQDRERQLGKVLERQDVEPPVARQQIRGVQVIAPEAGAVADPDRWAGHSGRPRISGSVDPTACLASHFASYPDRGPWNNRGGGLGRDRPLQWGPRFIGC